MTENKKMAGDYRFDLRLTKEEKDLIRLFAKGQGVTMKKFIMNLIYDYARKMEVNNHE